jgi:hypothetical protein
MVAGHIADRTSQICELITDLSHRGTDSGAHLDLAPQELWAHLTLVTGFTLCNELLRRIICQITGLTIYEKVLLLNPDR